jgi:methylglyoxal synthase
LVKKVILDLVSDNDSDTILTTKTISSAKEFVSIKKEGRRVSSLSPKRRSSSRSSVTSSRSAFSYKDFSKMSLVGEEDISIADNLEEEETSIARSDADSSSTVKEDRKTNSKEKKMKKKKKKKKLTSEGKRKSKNKTKSRRESVSPLPSRSPTPKSRSSMPLNSRMEEVLNDLHDLYRTELSNGENIPTCVDQRPARISSLSFVDQKDIMDESDDSTTDGYSVTSDMTGGSILSKPGTSEFYREMTSKLRPHRTSLCIQDGAKYGDTSGNSGRPGRRSSDVVSQVNDFEAAFEPEEMRCLALVSHNEMKATMKDFVIKYKNVLKKFRLTGTQSTMKMLGEVFEGDDSVIFGPACNSGPLGGDAELVAMMSNGQLGGILFFQDPMTAHPHQVDIECLVRQALVHNTVMATTPTTAMSIMEVLRIALEGSGRPEFIPSFFFSLQSPTVEAYKNNQKKAIASHATSA